MLMSFTSMSFCGNCVPSFAEFYEASKRNSPGTIAAFAFIASRSIQCDQVFPSGIAKPR
jgi:hypothetical protein